MRLASTIIAVVRSAVLVAAVTGCGDGSSSTTGPAPGGDDAPAGGILFVKRTVFPAERTSEIWVMNPDGTAPRRLTDGTALDLEPVFSPDGAWIAWTRVPVARPAGLFGDVYVMRADGSQARNLTEGVGGGSPAWSPDGTRLAFASARDGDAEIYVMRADGNERAQLTRNGVTDRQPTWSPDGRAIAFARVDPRADGGQISNVYVMNADGSGQRRVASLPALGDMTHPRFSPDGRRIGFLGGEDGLADLLVVNPNGSGLANLTRPGAFTFSFDIGGGQHSVPPQANPPIAFSPDGRRIAVGVAAEESESLSDLWVFAADGTASLNLTRTNDTTEFSPVFSSDGGDIAFAAVRTESRADHAEDTEIYVLGAAGGAPRRLTRNGDLDFPTDWR